MATIRHTGAAIINRFLCGLGVQLVRCSATVAPPASNPHVRGYVAAGETIRAAAAQGLPVSTYLRQIWGVPADKQRKVIEEIARYQVFQPSLQHLVEIGTGAGLYVEDVLRHCHPAQYQSYEPDPEWAQWLAATYPLTACVTDGKSLKETASATADLVMAHQVFAYIPFLTCYHYWLEIVRVTKPTGYLVFDIMSEECFTDDIAQRWLQADLTYPGFISKPYLTEWFARRGCVLQGSFLNPYVKGYTMYLIFQKQCI
jgi:hypothetical protein